MTTNERSTSSPVVHVPGGLVQPRHHDKGSYVQRWKVLRERNRNLPKIDFGVKNEYGKITRQQEQISDTSHQRQSKNAASLTLARSLTLESMKLPTISTSSVVTSTNASGTTGANTIKSTNSGKKKTLNIQDGSDATKSEKAKDLNGTLSKSLPNIANAVQQEGKLSNATKHRFEKIAHTKRMTTRKNETSFKDKDDQPLEQSGV